MATIEAMGQKRTITATEEAKGFSTRDLILIAVLLAAGAVLKLTVSSFLTFAGMKPNFMIAMYCLAIILTRPKVYQAGIIGLITGFISQIPMLNATPLVNIASELVGALVCGILVAAFLRARPRAMPACTTSCSPSSSPSSRPCARATCSPLSWAAR